MKKILLIGDSIRLGYDKYVKMAFEDVADVYYPEENSRFAAFVFRRLHEWKDELGCGDDIDLVHWNAGLWDDLILLDGKHFTPIDIYALYVERTCQMIKILFPMAKIIFATSTPVREEMFTGACKRYNQDTEKYNQVAVEIVKRYGGEINDLYSLAKASPVEWHSDLTHYYTKEGTRMLTEQVVWHIEQSIGIQGKTLDYDALFADTNDIVGI